MEERMSKTKAERFRLMAAECERQAELAAADEGEFREMQERLASSFHALVETEDWLNGRSNSAARAVPRHAYEAA
jgi:hypothetical protein